MQKLKVAIISKAKKIGGGASRVAEDLSDMLRASGHQVDHWIGINVEKQTNTRNLYSEFRFLRFGFRTIRDIVKYAGYPDLIPFEYLPMQAHDYDVLHFHDISSVASPLTIYLLARQKPVVWTFHDCSPFTAGCLYPFDCTQFKTVCTNCPQNNEWPIDSKWLAAKHLHNLKRYIHSKNVINCITCSTWMADMAMSSGLFFKAPEVIVNGVDVNFYKPFTKKQKKEFRKSLDIPIDRKVVVLISPSIQDKRKGIVHALSALKKLSDPKPFLLLVGNVNPETIEAFKNFDCHFAGYVHDEMKAKCFAGSDLFLFCSLADNMPAVVLETMACGTPTVGFKTGGIPEMVEQNKTGYLVEKENEEALVQALEYSLSGNNLEKWGKASRKSVESKFTMDMFFKKHLDLYYDLASKKVTG